MTLLGTPFGDLVERLTGLSLLRGGVSAALDHFVTKRMALLNLRRIEDYMALIADPIGAEQRLMINEITVPHTWFYRDSQQLQIVARLLAAQPPGPLAVWVAGCATGEEAYTLAMIGRRIGRELKVLATDVNEHALDHARRGVYNANGVREVPELERRWLPLRGNRYEVDDVLRGMVKFARHNLVEVPPLAPRGGWDLVLCRNVMIYFSPPAVTRLLERLARALREGGLLVVGAADVVLEQIAGLETVNTEHRMVLRRPPRPRPPASTPPPPSSTPPLPPTPPTMPRPLESRTTTERNRIVELRPTPSAGAPPLAPPAGRATTASGSATASTEDELVATLIRGHQQLERGEVATAIRTYNSLTTRYADVAEVWLFLGIAHYSHHEFDAAASTLRACLCLDPALWAASFYLARAYEQLGQRADALQQYDQIAAADALNSLSLRTGNDSVVINELRAYRHDLRNVARRVASDRGVSLRKLPALNPPKDRDPGKMP